MFVSRLVCHKIFVKRLALRNYADIDTQHTCVLFLNDKKLKIKKDFIAFNKWIYDIVMINGFFLQPR